MSSRTCSKGHSDKPINGVCPACLLIAEGNADRLDTLIAEVLAYLDGYTSRGIRSEELALAKLGKAAEKAAEGSWPAPSPGSPGSPEREDEQRARNERAARMAEKAAER